MYTVYILQEVGNRLPLETVRGYLTTDGVTDDREEATKWPTLGSAFAAAQACNYSKCKLLSARVELVDD